MPLDERLEKIEALLIVLVERQQVRESCEIEECARVMDKPFFICREWHRLGRIQAEKKLSGRGAHARWVVPHAELMRH